MSHMKASTTFPTSSLQEIFKNWNTLRPPLSVLTISG